MNKNAPTLSGQQTGAFNTLTTGSIVDTGPLIAASLSGLAITDSTTTTSSTKAASATALSNVAVLAAAALPKSGGVVTGGLTILGNLITSNVSVLGTYETVNAYETHSSNLVCSNLGTGPALSVSQVENGVLGPQPVATFTAGSNPAVWITNNGSVALGKTWASNALDVSGVVSATSFVGSGALLTGISSGGGGGMFKNLVINGDMQINQNGIVNLSYKNYGNFTVSFFGIAASTGSSQSLSTYVVDRFCVFRDSYASGCKCTQGWYNNSGEGHDISYAATNLPFSDSGMLYYAIIKRSASDTSTTNINMRYAFELTDTYQIYNTQVTLSFYYKTGANFSGSAINYGLIMGAGEGLQRGAVSVTNTLGTTASPSTSWVRASFTTTLPSITTSNLYLGLSFYYTPTGTAGSDDTLYITGVQLEKGSTSTSFEFCPYGTKYELCQRYYRTYDSTTLIQGLNLSSSIMYFPLSLSPPMRVPPTTLMFGTNPTVAGYGTSTFTVSSLPIIVSTTTSALVKPVCSGSITSNAGPLTLVAADYIAISAEM